jgi:three-Cys-motif partner protein
VDVLWSLEPATEAKHRLYKRYLDAWWAKLLQPTSGGRRWPRVTYVDAFAGPGRYAAGEEGSPVFALDRLLHHEAAGRMCLSRDRVRLVFIESDRARYDFLSAELDRVFGPLHQLPVTVLVRHGEAAHTTGPVLEECGAWGAPILTVFDSWGNVPFPLVQRIAHNRSSEVLVTFGPNWFSRRENQEPGQLDDAVFGGRQHWRPADQETDPDERWRAWLTTYREALRRAGFAYQLHFQVVPRTGQPLYLVYGTGHPSGVEAMKHAMWKVDTSDGMRFRDPRVHGAPPEGQLALWGGADPAAPELAELVRQRLREKPATLAELADWLLLETARWRRSDARAAVRAMYADGQVGLEPPSGRLTQHSLLTLR